MATAQMEDCEGLDVGRGQRWKAASRGNPRGTMCKTGLDHESSRGGVVCKLERQEKGLRLRWVQ